MQLRLLRNTNMRNDETFKKYLGSFGCAIADFYQELDDILSRANDDYKRGNLTLDQFAAITKMTYYLENIDSVEQ